MISVLLPTRGRPADLARSLESLYDLAAAPESVEVLLGFDDDDPTLQECLAVVERYSTPASGVHMPWYFVDPRRGYKRLHEYWNQLAAASRGDQILNWNDDAVMLTQGWDRLLQDGPIHTVQFIRRDIFHHADYTFPVTSRSIYNAMGHISLNAHADTWLEKVSEAAGCLVPRDDIVFTHFRLDDLTSAERDRNYDFATFQRQQMELARHADVLKVKEMLSNCVSRVADSASLASH